MLEKYVTIKGTGQAEVVEKKSRFIANVVPVHSEEEAMAEIEKFRKKYYDARHNVFAFQVGNEKQLQRYSDDGEPSGTAGMPVLDVIRGRDSRCSHCRNPLFWWYITWHRWSCKGLWSKCQRGFSCCWTYRKNIVQGCSC